MNSMKRFFRTQSPGASLHVLPSRRTGRFADKFPALMFALLGAFALLAPSTVFAGDDPAYAKLKELGGQAILEEADNRHNAFVDQTLKVQMTLKGGANDGDAIKIETITKGEHKRAIRFLEPSDLKGMGVVIKGRDEIYVRLPGTEKVRRVGSHAKRQSFQGTTWSFDEMAMIRFASDYTAKVKSEDDTHVTLELTQKADSSLGYPKLIAKVVKEHVLIQEIEYYDDSGQAVKRQKRKDPKKLDAPGMTFTHLEMFDLSTGNSTVTEVLEEKIDKSVKDTTFSRRWLVRGI